MVGAGGGGRSSYAALFAVHDRAALVLPFIGIGIAWASILTMPYVILADALPQRKLGIYMGIFNFFVVLPATDRGDDHGRGHQGRGSRRSPPIRC